MIGLPLLLALPMGVGLGLLVPHMVVSMTINRRTTKFIARFPDAIELLVRGLRSGLPITETMSVVGGKYRAPSATNFAPSRIG